MNGSRTIRFALTFPLQNLPVSGTQPIVVSRPYVSIFGQSGIMPRLSCFFDSGAAVSVISLPYRQNFRWRPVDSTAQELTTWNGFRCDFGETVIRLQDESRRLMSAPLRVTAKLLRVPVPFHNDRFIILGLNFLMDN